LAPRGVRVLANFVVEAAPWGKERDWSRPLLALCLGIGLYLAMRALGWVIDGFLGPRGEEPDANRRGA